MITLKTKNCLCERECVCSRQIRNIVIMRFMCQCTLCYACVSVVYHRVQICITYNNRIDAIIYYMDCVRIVKPLHHLLLQIIIVSCNFRMCDRPHIYLYIIVYIVYIYVQINRRLLYNCICALGGEVTTTCSRPLCNVLNLNKCKNQFSLSGSLSLIGHTPFRFNGRCTGKHAADT